MEMKKAMIRYLLEDFTGAASRTLYGKKGDQVNVINEHSGIALVDNGKELFHIRVERLSTEQPIIEKPETVTSVSINPLPMKRKIKSRPARQNKLF